MFHVPVVDINQKPLMPTTKTRALRWVKSRKATPFWKMGVWCVRLNVEPSARNLQEIVVGVDPGSKREGFSVVSKINTFLNVQVNAVTGVKEKVDNRRDLRRGRRNRNTPCRKNRSNRGSSKKPRLAPSTRARWGWKLRILKWLMKMFPVSTIVVEDVKAVTKKGQRQWNVNFSPIEIGKTWFYQEVAKIAALITRRGFETKALRDEFKLKKIKNKMSDNFHAHCVDAWVLAANVVGADSPTNKNVFRVVPLEFRRRSLHYKVNAKGGGMRATHGGTRSAGFRRGTLLKTTKRGLVYLGGSSNGRVSIHSLSTGKRLAQNVKIDDCKILRPGSWRFYVAK